MNALPTGTVTFLFADVEGSTQLVRTAGGAYAGLIADVRRLLRSEIAANGGAEVDATGDEISAVFQEVQPALSSALAGQEKIRDHAWPDGIVVKVRMGLHTGLPHLGDEGYTGLDVIRASRIAAAGHGGQVLLSSTAAPFVTEVETRDLGTHRLQGLPDPEAIHQVLADGLPRDFPPLRGTVSQLGDARRVVLADDSVLLREGVARLLEEAGFDVVAPVGHRRRSASPRLDAQARRRRSSTSGCRRPTPTRGSARRRRSAWATPVSASSFSRSTSSRRTRWPFWSRAPRASATCSRTASRTSSEFGTAVRRVADGGSALDPAVVSELVGRKRRDDPLDQLTAREREVLELMAEGRSNQAIAERLFVTLRAVEKHVTSIFTKLGLPASTDDHRRVLAVLAYLRA